jgi:hypothetical protein
LGIFGDLGNLLKKKPDFDLRNYGFPKLLPLIKSINKFETDIRETGNSNIKHIYVRIKQKIPNSGIFYITYSNTSSF